MSSITAYKKIIEGRCPCVLRTAVNGFKDRGITQVAIDQCIQNFSLPVLNAKTLEMAYDSFRVLSTAVNRGKQRCKLKVANAFNKAIDWHKINNTTSPGDLGKVFEAFYIMYSVQAAFQKMEREKNKEGDCFSFRYLNGYPTEIQLHNKGIAVIQAHSKIALSPRTTNSTMLFSEKAIHRIKNLKDTIIVVDGREFEINKTILSLQSDFFLQLFGQTEFKESKEKRFEIKQEGITQEAFEAYLAFVYEKKIPKKLAMQTLTSLYKLAHFLEDQDLMSALIIKIYQKLDKECFLEVLQLALAMNGSLEDKEGELTFWEKNNQFLLDMVEECLKMVPKAAIGFNSKKLDANAKLDLLTVALHPELLQDDEVREILLEKLIEGQDELFFEKICILGITNPVVRALCKSYFARHKDTIDSESALHKSYIAVLLSQTKSSTKKVVQKVAVQRSV